MESSLEVYETLPIVPLRDVVLDREKPITLIEKAG